MVPNVKLLDTQHCYSNCREENPKQSLIKNLKKDISAVTALSEIHAHHRPQAVS